VSVRREQLEARFIDLLRSTQPRPEFMRLFREIVLEVWSVRRRDAADVAAALLARMGDLKGRETLLERAYIYDQKIDAEAYERQRDDLRCAMTMAAIELEDARANDLDVEALLRFSENVLCNAAGLWQDAAPDQKQRLQAALFPKGLRMRDGGFGTVVTSLAFKYFGENGGGNSGMASQDPPTWNQIREFLTAMQRLRDSVGNAA